MEIDATKIPLPPRAEDGHKYNFGSVLIVAGSRGKTGAGTLSSLAALRSGCGMVTWALPASLAMIPKIQSPEIIVRSLPEISSEFLSLGAREHLLEASQEANSIVVGPGMSPSGESGELIRLIIPEIIAPLIVDASALRAVAEQQNLFTKREDPTILTPHSGEMSWLIGKSHQEIDRNRVEYARNYAQATKSIVVLKGRGTVITNGEQVAINPTGNNGMATAGCGDVLTGVIAGLIAQNMEAFSAAVLGVYLHGLAGDLAAEKFGCHSLIASDVIDFIPAAFVAHAKRVAK